MGGGFLMTAYLGPVGGLRPVEFTTSEPESAPPNITYTTYLDGTVREQVGPRPRRSWDVGGEYLTAGEWGIVDAIAGRAFGVDPIYWYSATASVTNLLTPHQTSLVGTSWLGTKSEAGGAGEAADGTFYEASIVSEPGADLFLSSGHPHAKYVAVPAGRPVTASMVASAFSGSSGWWAVTEYGPMGTPVGASNRVDIPAGESRNRRSITFTTGPTTVSVRISARNLLMVTQPQITLTDRPVPWAHGMGCQSASVSRPGWSPQRGQLGGVDAPHVLGSRDFTIQEIG
jgi:hypothetical protein